MAWSYPYRILIGVKIRKVPVKVNGDTPGYADR